MVLSIGGVILTGENRSTRRGGGGNLPHYHHFVCHGYHAGTGLGSNESLRAATVRLSSVTALVRGGAVMFLARPGRKQATTTKNRDLFNTLPTKLNTLLSQLL